MKLWIQLMESAAEFVFIIQGKLIPVYKEMAELIYEGAKEIEKAINCLKNPVANKEKIIMAFNRVTAIEHDADELYFTGISELFEKEEDTKELLRPTRFLISLKDVLMKKKMLQIL